RIRRQRPHRRGGSVANAGGPRRGTCRPCRDGARTSREGERRASPRRRGTIAPRARRGACGNRREPHERTDPTRARTKPHRGRAVAIAAGASLDAPTPKGCRRVADGVAIFIAPDDATALAAAGTLRAGAVIAPSGLLVLPGLARIVDPRQRAERDATTQLAAMAARLHEELITAERAQRDVLAQRADAERRREEADKRLAAAQSARGDAEVTADKLATAEADVRDLVRAQEASAGAIERERAELLTRREKLARDSEVAAAARNTAADVFATSERGEQVAVDAHNAASKRAEEARLQSATMEERRGASVRVRDALSEQVSATERRIADEEERLRALVAQERDSRGRAAAGSGKHRARRRA